MSAATRPRYDAERITEVIFRYASRIGAEQDTDKLLQLNADMARDLSGADRCSLWLRDEKQKELWTKVAHGTKEIRIPEGTGLVGACVHSGEPLVVNDVHSDPRFFQKVDSSSGYVTNSVLVIPLRGAIGAVIGALQVLNKPDGFSAADLEILGLAASYAASAVETQQLQRQAEAARLLYRELEIARGVQQKLLPQTFPPVPGIQYAGVCRAAKFVGGDYYDFGHLEDNSFALTLGDVSGKGVAAAVLMASIHASLRAQLLSPSTTLARRLSNLNAAIYASTPPDKYSTLFCAVIDPSRREMTYVNAGQVKPMLIRRGQVLHLEESGVPIGLLPAIQYEQASVQLEPGDLIICVSDGISEAENATGEFWEESGVEAVAAACTGVDVVSRLVQGADHFAAGHEQSDDMTVIAVML
jgi:phosphoserine phosphatase RsbU/P